MIPEVNWTDPPERVKAALEEVADGYSDLASDLRADLADAEDGEAVLELAERSALEMLERLPLSPVYCPFCTIHRLGAVDCQGCGYAARYGRCTEAGTPYDLAIRAHYRLVEAVEDLRRVRQPRSGSSIPKDKVRAALADQAERVVDLAGRFQRRVKNARSAEELMALKTEFMADLVGSLPIDRLSGLCGFDDRPILEAKREALQGLMRHWPAA